MRTWVIAILSTACLSQVVDAFWLPQPSSLGVTVRQPQTALQGAKQSGYDVTMRNFKYFLVPNAKQEKISLPVAPADTSLVAPVAASAPVVPTPVVSAPEVPRFVPEVPKVVPEPPAVLHAVPKPPAVLHAVPKPPAVLHAVPKPPVSVPEVPRMEQSSSHFDVNSVVHTMQENYKSALGAIHDGPRSPGTASSLVDYIKQGKYAGDGESVGDRLKHLPSFNFEALKEMKDMQPIYFDNLKKSLDGGGFSSGGAAQMLQLNFDKMMGKMIGSIEGARDSIPVDKLTNSFQSLGALLQKDGFATAQEAIDALDLDELGAYYLGIIGLFVVVARSGSGMDTDSALSSVVVDAIETGKVVTQSETMQGQIVELTRAITAMSKEMKALQGGKATRDYEIATMKSDTRDLRNQLDASASVESDLRLTLKKMDKEKIAMSKEVETLKKEADGLRKQLEAAKTTGATLAPRSAPAPAVKASPKKVAMKTSPAPMPQPVAASPAPAPVAKAPPAPAPVAKASPAKVTVAKEAPKKTSPVLTPEPPLSPPPAAVMKASTAEVAKEAPKKTSPTPKPEPEAAAPAPFFSSVTEAGARGAFFSSITEPSTPVEEPVVKGSPKKAAKKASKKVSKKTEESKATEVKETVAASSKVKGVSSAQTTKEAASSDDWSQLSDSTLKRKTVKALTEYLISKNASVTDPAGSTLKKSELVEVVRSLGTSSVSFDTVKQ